MRWRHNAHFLDPKVVQECALDSTHCDLEMWFAPQLRIFSAKSASPSFVFRRRYLLSSDSFSFFVLLFSLLLPSSLWLFLSLLFISPYYCRKFVGSLTSKLPLNTLLTKFRTFLRINPDNFQSPDFQEMKLKHIEALWDENETFRNWNSKKWSWNIWEETFRRETETLTDESWNTWQFDMTFLQIEIETCDMKFWHETQLLLM